MSKKKIKNVIDFTEYDFNVPSIPSLLKDIIIRPQAALKQFCKQFLEYKGYKPVSKDGYLYAKGEIPVMLVAHLDTVHKESVKEIFVSTNLNITSPQGIGGDDRCGVYTIFKTLIDTGLKPYILFAEDEEIGCVGSSKFEKDLHKYDPEVNFIIEIDRKGSNDAVYYECDNEDFEKFITSYGFETDYGSFSDIAVIAPTVGVAAVNLSSGYYKPHTTEEYINFNDLNNTIMRVEKIVTDVANNKTQKYEYIAASRYSLSKLYGWNSLDYDWDDYNADFGYCNYYNETTDTIDHVAYVDEIEVVHLDLSEATIIIQNGDKEFAIDEFSSEANNYFMDVYGNVYLYYESFDGLLSVYGATVYSAAGLPLQYSDEETFEVPLYETVASYIGGSIEEDGEFVFNDVVPAKA